MSQFWLLMRAARLVRLCRHRAIPCMLTGSSGTTRGNHLSSTSDSNQKEVMCQLKVRTRKMLSHGKANKRRRLTESSWKRLEAFLRLSTSSISMFLWRSRRRCQEKSTFFSSDTKKCPCGKSHQMVASGSSRSSETITLTRCGKAFCSPWLVSARNQSNLIRWAIRRTKSHWSQSVIEDKRATALSLAKRWQKWKDANQRVK